MSLLDRQLDIAAALIQGYSHSAPFHLYLQEQFRIHRQFGSRDRRWYREACYAYWHGAFSAGTHLKTGIAIALYLRNPQDHFLATWLETHLSGFKTGMGKDAIQALGIHFGNPYLPFSDLLEPTLDSDELNEWFQHPAPLWICVPEKNATAMTAGLREAGIPFESNSSAYKLPAGAKIDGFIENGDAWVQDLGSQRSIRKEWIKNTDAVWDCCCGAGGKSLQIRMAHPGGILYASDKRNQSIQNLKQRMLKTGFEIPVCGECDLSRPSGALQIGSAVFNKPVFDVIVADVPCSGSGTWRRNPENRAGFRGESLENFVNLQRRIISHALPYLKPGGKLIYLTCSVFKAENSENVAWLNQQFSLTTEEQGFSGGAKQDADYIYFALIRKN